MRAAALPCSHPLCGAVLFLLAVGCNAPDATDPSAALPQTKGESSRVPAATPSSLSVTGKIAFVRNGDIYVLTGSGTVTRLTSNGGNGQPSWSPDGSKIAFVRSGEVYAMNADGTGVTRLTNNTFTDKAPAWSPNGGKIAFVSNRADQHDEIYVMNANGTGVTRLTKNLPQQGCNIPCRAEEAPTWSPDGSKIAFVHRANPFGRDIDIMNANGSGVTRLTNAGFATKLAWGRTGKIAFDTQRQPSGGLGDYEIALVTVSGAAVSWLTNNTSVDLYPTWSPDGTRIAFESDRSGNGDIYMMNANGSGLTRLTSNSALESEPAWGS